MAEDEAVEFVDVVVPATGGVIGVPASEVEHYAGLGFVAAKAKPARKTAKGKSE